MQALATGCAGANGGCAPPPGGRKLPQAEQSKRARRAGPLPPQNQTPIGRRQRPASATSRAGRICDQRTPTAHNQREH
eukprot:scaffold10220_cov144-Isochrysis_galbana.AAC.3